MTKRALLVLALLLAPLSAYAISTASDRAAVSEDYLPTAGGVNTRFDRMAASGDFLPGGSSVAGSGTGSGMLLLRVGQ